MVVGAEEPGIGLGAALAGLDSVDPGAGFGSAPPIATASFGKHDFPLWQGDSPGRAVFAGEVKGLWLWVVLWPDTAGTLLVEPLRLRDLRDPGQDFDLPFGAASPRLPAPRRSSLPAPPRRGMRPLDPPFKCALPATCTAGPGRGPIPPPR